MIILIILVPMDDFPSEMPYFLGFQSAVAGGAPLKVLNLPGDDAWPHVVSGQPKLCPQKNHGTYQPCEAFRRYIYISHQISHKIPNIYHIVTTFNHNFGWSNHEFLLVFHASRVKSCSTRRSLGTAACQPSGCCIRRSPRGWRACPETHLRWGYPWWISLMLTTNTGDYIYLCIYIYILVLICVLIIEKDIGIWHAWCYN